MSKITDWIIEQEASGEIVFNEQDKLYEPRNKTRRKHGRTPARRTNAQDTIRGDVLEGRSGYSCDGRGSDQETERGEERLQALARSIWGAE